MSPFFYCSINKQHLFKKALKILQKHFPTQLFINFHSREAADCCVIRQEDIEAILNANTMQQMEFTISGNEVFVEQIKLSLSFLGIEKVQAIAEQVSNIVKQAKGSRFVKNDFAEVYYGIGIKLKDEASRLGYTTGSISQAVYTGFSAGKTVNTDKAGLQANIADQEQNILKLNIQVQDYMGDLTTITGITANSIRLAEIAADIQSMNPVEEYQSIAKNSNVDLQIANLNKSKAALGIKSSRQSNIPELGLTGGYAHQFGNALLPVNNTFIGLSLKWDLQSIFSNKQITRQRQFGLKQAEEHFINTELQVSNDIKKAYRKIDQTQALIAVAQKSVTYRQEELKIQQDKQAADLNKSTDLLNTKALLAKARADMYTAQLSYRMAISDLKILTGQ